MAETNTFLARKRYAVVTGSNKGVGFEICKQYLASQGVNVVVTSRDEKKGHEAIEKLKILGLSEHVMFHQLDVTKPSSVSSLADFVRMRFGILDILVNNAAVLGTSSDWQAIQAFLKNGILQEDFIIELQKIMRDSDGTPEECLETNYYGAKRMVEALLPLLQLSDSPRIVNVSSFTGQLKNIPSEDVKGLLRNVESLTEEKVDELLSEFLNDFKQGSLETKGWPTFQSTYMMSKASMNAYTRLLARKHPRFRINCVCPGYVKTDITNYTGIYNAEEGAQGPVNLALLPDDGPSGFFFQRNEVSPF